MGMKIIMKFGVKIVMKLWMKMEKLDIKMMKMRIEWG